MFGGNLVVLRNMLCKPMLAYAERLGCPAGSGKTSLLSVLGGRTPKAVRMQGKVLYNDQPLTKAVKRKIGFVLQVGMLCVWLLEAELRLSHDGMCFPIP